ncbi:hypothetical protein [Planococcus chinensis]|uniref:Uncharacterized protein n=1 Tax=Planococcus chinensis TaxID=272917 RepID=A0ABW4QF15_9BACL
MELSSRWLEFALSWLEFMIRSEEEDLNGWHFARWRNAKGRKNILEREGGWVELELGWLELGSIWLELSSSWLEFAPSWLEFIIRSEKEDLNGWHFASAKCEREEAIAFGAIALKERSMGKGKELGWNSSQVGWNWHRLGWNSAPIRWNSLSVRWNSN